MSFHFNAIGEQEEMTWIPDTQKYVNAMLSTRMW